MFRSTITISVLRLLCDYSITNKPSHLYRATRVPAQTRQDGWTVTDMRKMRTQDPVAWVSCSEKKTNILYFLTSNRARVLHLQICDPCQELSEITCFEDVIISRTLGLQVSPHNHSAIPSGPVWWVPFPAPGSARAFLNLCVSSHLSSVPLWTP